VVPPAFAAALATASLPDDNGFRRFPYDGCSHLCGNDLLHKGASGVEGNRLRYPLTPSAGSLKAGPVPKSQVGLVRGHYTHRRRLVNRPKDQLAHYRLVWNLLYTEGMELRIRAANGGEVTQSAPGRWLYRIPAGPAGSYRWAQRDDHLDRSRADFPVRPPVSMSLRARVSAPDLPGTWGFGLWNDPFSMSFGISGAARRLPALPNAAWFFFASPHNYLSFRNDTPANGFLAATFRSPHLPAPLLVLGAPALALLLTRPSARLLRKLARVFIQESASSVAIDVTTWNSYRLDWLPDRVLFYANETLVHETEISPAAPLGLVIWIDNQFAAFRPDGRWKFGTLENFTPAWMEVEDLRLNEIGA